MNFSWFQTSTSFRKVVNNLYCKVTSKPSYVQYIEQMQAKKEINYKIFIYLRR